MISYLLRIAFFIICMFARREMPGISQKQNAGVAERQTRWFQVPVLRDVWVQIPSPAPKKGASSRCSFFAGRRLNPPPRQPKVINICFVYAEEKFIVLLQQISLVLSARDKVNLSSRYCHTLRTLGL